MEETRIDGPFSNKEYHYVPRQVRGITLYPWQKEILEDRCVWDTRTINCVIQQVGNVGKNTLVTYAGCHNLARRIPMLESYKDFMRMVMDTPKSKLYLIDFPKMMNKAASASFWSAIETVKDGYAYDDRYSWSEAYFDSPNIWVFMNHEPEIGNLSTDRWRFWTIPDKKGKLERYTFSNPVDLPNKGVFKASHRRRTFVHGHDNTDDKKLTVK